MTGVIRLIESALHAVLKLFVDDGLYTAITVAWITVVVSLGPRRGLVNQTVLVSTGESHHANVFVLGGLLLAFGLDLIFTVSVILRVRSAVRKQTAE